MLIYIRAYRYRPLQSPEISHFLPERPGAETTLRWPATSPNARHPPSACPLRGRGPPPNRIWAAHCRLGTTSAAYRHTSPVAVAIPSQKDANRAVSCLEATCKRVLVLWTELGTARGRTIRLGAVARLCTAPVQRYSASRLGQFGDKAAKLHRRDARGRGLARLSRIVRGCRAHHRDRAHRIDNGAPPQRRSRRRAPARQAGRLSNSRAEARAGLELFRNRDLHGAHLMQVVE